MFFTYTQNNSGGSFEHEPGKYGFAVVIEAETAAQANSKAEDLGLYFDGESDCPCCGRRWTEVDAVDGEAEPEIYGQPLAKNATSDNRFGWWGLPIYVHYLDGRVEKHEHIRDVQRRAES